MIGIVCNIFSSSRHLVISSSMNIILNGKPYKLEKPACVQELLSLLALEKSQIAVEINREIVSRSRHEEVFLNDGDAVEIVSFIGGG